MWLILALIFFVLAIGFLFWIRLKESRYLRKPIRDILSEELRSEINEEKAQFYRKRALFQKALGKASQKK